MHSLQRKVARICCPARVKLGLSQVAVFIGAPPLYLSYESWKDVQLRLLRYVSGGPIFMQVRSTKHWLALVKLNLPGALFNFFPSPTPVWYFGDSLFTEARGDDNGLLLIPCWAGALCTLGHKSAWPHPMWTAYSVLHLIEAISQIFLVAKSKFYNVMVG